MHGKSTLVHDVFREVGVRYVRFARGWIVMLALAVGCAACTSSLLPTSNSTPLAEALLVTLAFDGEPALNREVTLTASMTAREAAPNTHLDVSLPANLLWVSGPRHWQGALRANQTLTLSMIVELTEAGSGEVQALAIAKSSDAAYVGRSASLYVECKENGTVTWGASTRSADSTPTPQ